MQGTAVSRRVLPKRLILAVPGELKMAHLCGVHLYFADLRWSCPRFTGHSGLKMRSPREFIAAQTATA